MEHLAWAIRATAAIHGITIGSKTFNLTLFENDVLLFLTDPLYFPLYTPD